MLYFIEIKKKLGSWTNDGGCFADHGDAPACGPGTQNQTRTCEDGTIDKCTEQVINAKGQMINGDKMQTISCDAGLPDCGKLWQFN